MSVVATVITENAIYLGADSAVTYGEHTQISHPSSKVFVEGDIIVGGVGDPDHVTLFRTFLQENPPQEPTLIELVEMFQDFRQYVSDHGTSIQDQVGNYKSQFHLIMNGTAWVIDGYFIRQIESYEAVGEGEDYARSALYLGHDIVDALDVACKFNIFCEYPLWIYRVTDDDITLNKIDYRTNNITRPIGVVNNT